MVLSTQLKVRVLDHDFVEPIEVSEKSTENVDIVQVVLGNANQVFNHLNGSEDHFLFVKEASGYYVSSITNKQDNLNVDHNLNLKEFNTSNKNEICEDQEPVNVELWKFYNPKGPPVLC